MVFIFTLWLPLVGLSGCALTNVASATPATPVPDNAVVNETTVDNASYASIGLERQPKGAVILECRS